MRENIPPVPLSPRPAAGQRILAVSEATKRDVQNLLTFPPNEFASLQRSGPSFFAEPSVPRSGVSEQKQRMLERYQIDYPFLLYAGSIRPHKNVPRLIEAFAVVRNHLADHPVYRDLRLIIIGDEISRNPEVRRAVIQTRNQQAVRFLGFVPLTRCAFFYSAARVIRLSVALRGIRMPPLEAMATGTPVVTPASVHCRKSWATRR